MSLELKLGSHFKPEIKTYGAQEFSKGTVFISNHSDTQIQATMKSMIPIRISLRSESISNSEFTASCNCNVYTKGNLCKHIWAVLLTVEQKHPDFLDSKTDVQMVPVMTNPTQARNKAKQNEFKKALYEKQKQRIKDQKKEQKRKNNESPKTKFSEDIESAIEFFSVNGFEINESTDPEILNKAKKSLYRVFHPDKGGSHDEAVNLNEHLFTVIIHIFISVKYIYNIFNRIPFYINIDLFKMGCESSKNSKNINTYELSKKNNFQEVSKNGNFSNTNQISRGKTLYIKQEAEVFSKDDECRQKIELFLKLENIQIQGNYSIRVYISNDKSNNKKFNFLSETEKLNNFTNIKFNSSIVTNYYFEKEQTLKVEILKEGIMAEETQIPLGRVMGARRNR